MKEEMKEILQTRHNVNHINVRKSSLQIKSVHNRNFKTDVFSCDLVMFPAAAVVCHVALVNNSLYQSGSTSLYSSCETKLILNDLYHRFGLQLLLIKNISDTKL